MIVTTGDVGFIGGSIVKPLGDKSITDILVVDNLKDDTKFVNLVDLDVADYMDKEDFLTQIMAGEDFGGIEAIFHKGVCSSTTERDDKYMMDSNHQYSKELLHYYLEHEVPFLYVSSITTYSSRTSDFIRSHEYEKPLNVCGYSKFLFDECVCQILPEANSQTVGFRYFNTYRSRKGHKGSMANAAFRLSAQLNNGETPKLSGGSENFKRDLVYAGGMAVVNLWFLENGVPGIFDLGTGRTESFQAVADTTLAYHRKDSVEYIPFPEKLKGRYQAFIQADPMNLHAAGYDKLLKTVAEGVTEYMAWLNHDT